MNCLKCENFWKSYIDETKCDRCGCSESNEQKETEEKANEGTHSLPG